MWKLGWTIFTERPSMCGRAPALTASPLRADCFDFAAGDDGTCHLYGCSDAGCATAVGYFRHKSNPFARVSKQNSLFVPKSEQNASGACRTSADPCRYLALCTEFPDAIFLRPVHAAKRARVLSISHIPEWLFDTALPNN